MPDRVSLARRHILLTGASRGIGRSLAVQLAACGARLSLGARTAADLQETARVARASGAAAVSAFEVDLAETDSTLAFYQAAKREHGVPDVLINNAGFNSRKAPIHAVGVEEFDSIMAVNLRAPFLLVREALPEMIARGSGHIVNVLSTVCHSSMETMGAYTAAKKGLEGLHGVLLKEARPHGVRVSAVFPGGTDTAFRPNSRPDYMRPDSVAAAIQAILTAPEDLIVHSLTFRPMVETNF